MRDPVRLLEGGGTTFEQELLGAAASERPDPAISRRMLAGAAGALGTGIVGSGVIGAGGGGATSGSAQTAGSLVSNSGNALQGGGAVHSGALVQGGALQGANTAGTAGSALSAQVGLTGGALSGASVAPPASALALALVKWGGAAIMAGVGLVSGLYLFEEPTTVPGEAQSGASSSRTELPQKRHEVEPKEVSTKHEKHQLTQPGEPEPSDGPSMPEDSERAAPVHAPEGRPQGTRPGRGTEVARGATAPRSSASDRDASGRDASDHEAGRPSVKRNLRAELSLLDQVRAALSKEEPDRALALLSAYSERFPEGELKQEATVLRVEALSARGQMEEAGTLSDQFLDEHPQSAHKRRLERSKSR